MNIEWLINETWQVIDEANECKNVLFQGSLSDCNAFIQARKLREDKDEQQETI